MCFFNTVELSIYTFYNCNNYVIKLYIKYKFKD